MSDTLKKAKEMSKYFEPKEDEIDYIRVWYCSQCAIYDIDFANHPVYCHHCGRKMIARTYEEVKK